MRSSVPPRSTTTNWMTISELRAARVYSVILLPTICRFIGSSPASGIGNPAVDVGFPPAGAVDADPHLGGEGALGDLALDGGTGQPGPGENGFHADDAVCYEHGCAASCRVFLTIAETRQSDDLLLCNRYLEVVVVWRGGGGK